MVKITSDNAPVATTATIDNAPVATTATTDNAPVGTTATTDNAPVKLTAAQIKAQYQAMWDAKKTSGQKAAFTKRLQAQGVPESLLPLATKKPAGHADDSAILALLAQFQG